MSQYRRVTMIEDLPEIVPQQGTREYHVTPDEAGMKPSQQPPRIQPPPQPQVEEPYSNSTVHLQPRMAMMAQPTFVDRLVGGSEVMPSYTEPYAGLAAANCLDLANHAQQCPICTKLYKTDVRLYLIIIAVLAIIILLLFKKVLDSLH